MTASAPALASSRAAPFDAIQPLIDAAAAGGRPLALLLLRLQRLGEINILFGYETSEALMQSVAARLRAALRPADRVLRHGEGEFLLVLPDLLSPNHALLAAHRALRALQAPLLVDGQRLLATAAIGVALSPNHGDAADLLCRCAEAAYGDALDTHDRVAMFSARETPHQVPFVELRSALERAELEVHLQPIVDLRSGRIVGAESLARWNSPHLGPVSPAVFVPLAEQTGLIGELTRWSVHATLRHAQRLRLPQRGLQLSINLSPRVFGETGFAEEVLDALRIWDIPAPSVVVEVTEGAVMEEPGRSAEMLRRLHDAGLRIAIDDFGVGYSSFAYLQRFPATELKIDRSFIMDLGNDARTAQLVRSMIDLAHHLHLRVVAEGVEDEATLNLLADMGCDLAQGWHLGHPQPPESLAALLDRGGAVGVT